MIWSTARRTLGIVALIGLAWTSLSCGGGAPSSGLIGVASGTGYVFIGDAPPSGTSILKFEITLNGATLCPTVGSAGECQGSPQVQLITQPVTVELKQLELGSSFLSATKVMATTYAGVKLTFSNPQLKVLNPDGTIQDLDITKLSFNPSTVAATFPSPLTVSANTNFAFRIDLDANQSIQSSTSAITGIAPVVTLVPLTVSSAQAVAELADKVGIASNVTKTCPTGSFTLLDSMTGISLGNVQFDSTTTFSEGLTCDTLSNFQVVEASLDVQAPSQQTMQFFAKDIELVNSADEHSLEGTVLQVNPFDQAGNLYQFVLLVHDQQNVSGITDGALLTISFDPTKIVFGIDSVGLTVDPTTFDSGSELLAGQSLEVDVLSGSLVIGTNNCAAVTDDCTATAQKIRLKRGTTSGKVAGTATPNITLSSLPSLLGTSTLLRPLSADCQNCSIASITVVTSAQTEFEGLAGGSTGLQVGQTVAVRGLLIKNAFQGPGPIGSGSPQLVAEKVRLVTP